MPNHTIASRIHTFPVVSVGLLCIVFGSMNCSRGGGRHAGANANGNELTITRRVDHLDLLAREPMVVEHPGGTLFVAGYGESRPTLWKSGDQGATWTRVDVGTEASGAIGNSDVDLAVAPDGTLYFMTMVFDRKAGEGRSVSIGVSRDIGASWSWTPLSRARFDDRPWIDVARDGHAHAIWNDGAGVNHAVSVDGGRTWTRRPRIHDHGGSSHLAVGPGGQVAVRIAPLSASGNIFDEGVDLIAVSTDGGATWQKHAAPGQREWAAMIDRTVTPPKWVEPEVPRWVEPIAWDQTGRLYSLWTTRDGLWLARSPDRGATWTTWQLANNRDVLHFPYLTAQGRGELAATWFSGKSDTLHAHVARIDVVDDSASMPRIIELPPFQIDVWGSGESPDDPRIRDSAGEYLPVIFLRNGELGVVSPIQDKRATRFGFTWWMIGVR